MRLNSKQIAEFTGATVIVEALDPSQLALGITWDSRDVQEDFVYVALPGERRWTRFHRRGTAEGRAHHPLYAGSA